MTTLAYFGPIPLDMLGDFDPSRSGDSSRYGTPFTFSGVVRKPEAEQLKELVGNRDRRIDFGRFSGVLEPIWIQNRPEVFGFYLMDRFDYSETHMQQLKAWASFTLDCVKLDHREIIVTRSARVRTNDYSLTPRSTIVQPFWGEDEDGEPFATPPGGTAFSRDYDSRTDSDVRSPTTTNRKLRIHSGIVS